MFLNASSVQVEVRGGYGRQVKGYCIHPRGFAWAQWQGPAINALTAVKYSQDSQTILNFLPRDIVTLTQNTDRVPPRSLLEVLCSGLVIKITVNISDMA